MSDIRPPAVDGQPETSKPASRLTLGQHFFIWAMVIIVGVLFGMGSSVSLLQHGPRSIQGVSENDVLVRQDIARRLQDCLNPSRRPQYGAPFALIFEHQNQAWYAQDILRARYAAGLGLLPEGADLDRVVADFLAKPMPGQAGRTLRDVLVEHAGGRDEVTPTALRRFLAERKAVEALVARHVAVPAIPPVYASDLPALLETAETDEVVLSARHLLQPVKEEDPDVQQAYDRLRATRFARPAAATVLVAYPDLAALAAAEPAPAEAEVAAWYEANKERFRKTADPKAGVAAGPEYRPLAEVSAEAVAAIRRTRAEPKAAAAMQRFADRLDQIGHLDTAAFAAEAATAGLVVSKPIEVPEGRGQLQLGELGSVKDQIGLFSSQVEPGFISSPLAMPAGGMTSQIVVRLESRRAAGFRSLDEVKPEVMAWVGGRRAYKALLEQAEAIRVAVEQAGPGGLAAWSGSEAAKPWQTILAHATQGMLTDLLPPPAEADGQPGEARPLAALCLPSRPVMLATAEGPGDLPVVRLVQVRAIKPSDKADDPARAAGFASQYRQALFGYRAQLFDEELRRKVQP